MIPGVEAEDLAFTYRGGNGISRVSFRVNPGEICCIYGKNGAGKSTLLNLLSTWYQPESGLFRIMGIDGIRQKALARTMLFPVFDENAHFDTSTGRENLDFFNTIYHFSFFEDIDRICEVLELNLDVPVGQYSLGMKRKLMLAESLASGKPVLLYDEPTLGLDSQTKERFFSIVRNRAHEGAVVLYGTNRVEEVLQGDRILCLTRDGIREVQSNSDLISSQIPVKITFQHETFTEYLDEIDDLPALITRILPLGTPRTIEVMCPIGMQDNEWTTEARDKIRRAPKFIQPMIKKFVVRFAQEKGYIRITSDVVDEAKRRFEQR